VPKATLAKNSLALHPMEHPLFRTFIPVENNILLHRLQRKLSKILFFLFVWKSSIKKEIVVSFGREGVFPLWKIIQNESKRLRVKGNRFGIFDEVDQPSINPHVSNSVGFWLER